MIQNFGNDKLKRAVLLIENVDDFLHTPQGFTGAEGTFQNELLLAMQKFGEINTEFIEKAICQVVSRPKTNQIGRQGDNGRISLSTRDGFVAVNLMFLAQRLGEQLHLSFL